MWKTKLINFILRIARIGADPADDDNMRIRKMVGITSIILGGIPAHIFLGILYLLLDEPLVSAISFAGAGLMLMGVFAFARSCNFPFYNFYWLTITIVSPMFTSLVLGGLGHDSFIMLWSLIVPLLALITARLRYVGLWFAVFVLEMTFLTVVTPYLTPSGNIPEPIQRVLFLINVISITALYLSMLFYYALQNRQLVKLAQDAHLKSESLLRNILPTEIASRLKDNQQIIADYFPEASILFADIVDFTPMSATMSPVQLVELLNDIFSHLDTLTERYGLEKIKTIGDCYMVAAGVPRSRPDHAQVLAQMALDIQQYVRDRQFTDDKTIAFRIGVNSGPVVAGVIGRRKFIYDLWGDTVNTASRMESHGSGGFIQVTENTYELLKDEFVCESRGSILVKGKGEMPVWYIMSRAMSV